MLRGLRSSGCPRLLDLATEISNVWALANDDPGMVARFFFFEMWLAVAFQWLGVARGGFLWLL